MREIHVLNLGAGVQSTTLYLMFLGGELPIKLDAAIFADTGEEPRAVYEHIAWLQSLRGPEIIIRSAGRLGDDLQVGRNATSQRFAQIPAFTMGGESAADDPEKELSSQENLALERYVAEGWPEDFMSQELKEKVGRTQRQCSKEYKVEVIERTIRRHMAGLAPGQRLPKKEISVHQYVGISLDESGRFTRLQRRRKLGTMHAPLIDRHMTRKDCVRWLEERGNVPHVVPRSACVFCPFHDDVEWQNVKAVPEDWARAVEIDEALRIHGNVANRSLESQLFVHRSCKPLVQVDLRPQKEKGAGQATLGFWRSDSFSRECLGVCGL